MFCPAHDINNYFLDQLKMVLCHSAILLLHIPQSPPLSFDLNQSKLMLHDGLSVSHIDKLWFDSCTSLSRLKCWPCTTRIHTLVHSSMGAGPRHRTALVESRPCPLCGKGSVITQLSQRHHERDLMMDVSGSESSDSGTFDCRTQNRQHLRSWSSWVVRVRGQCLIVGALSHRPVFVRHLQAKMTWQCLMHLLPGT